MKSLIARMILALTVMTGCSSLVFPQTKLNRISQTGDESKIEYRPIIEIAGKKRVYVGIIPRERVPGTTEGNSPWHEYPIWKPDMMKMTSSWEAKAKDILKKAGFTIIEDDAKADFIIYVGTDGWCHGDSPCMYAYIVSAEKSIHPADQKTIVYYQYRLVEVNPEPKSPRIAKDQWLDAGLNGFLWSYQK